jgi:hypothetical protein
MRKKVSKRPFSICALGILAGIVFFAGCTPKFFLIPEYQKQRPLSVLVLPPVNQTPQEGVEDVVYPIFVRAIGEKGYYVYSPEYVQEIFHRNKLQEAGRIHALPYKKFYDVFGPDAILYITVEKWAAKYYLIGNMIDTQIFARLIDAKTGVELFNMRYQYTYDPAAAQSSIAGKLIVAIASKFAEKSYLVPAARVNIATISKQLPKGLNDDKW